MKKTYLLLSLSAFIFLASCNNNPPIIKKYTIKFINDDGVTLQTSEVEEGAIPIYEGEIPHKDAPSEHEYVYIGWDKPIVKATEDTTYKATYDYVFLLGSYPQTLVTDIELIKVLDTKSPEGEYGYINYEDKSYFECISMQDYKADDGTRVKENDDIYKYYEVKPIQWKILGNEDDKFYTTYKLLDTCKYNDEDKTETETYPNQYDTSELRYYLNSIDEYEGDGFKWRAFREDDTKRIDAPKIINDDDSTCDPKNPYVCDDIAEGVDQIFALSRKELRTAEYGFIEKDNIDSNRIAKSTDYARAKDATLYNDNASIYWSRSPSGFTEPEPYKYSVYNVICDGAITHNPTDYRGRCIRPAIKLLK